MSNQKITCWHFIPDDRMLAHQTPPMAVEPGFIYGKPEGPIDICVRGMHGSRRVYDALNYSSSSTLCRVQIWGDIQEHDDKLVGRYREVLAIRDVASELRLWACWCIRNTSISGGRTVWDLLSDPRSRNAVETAERFARGEATREELAAAWAAAGDAAGKFQADELERRMVALFAEQAAKGADDGGERTEGRRARVGEGERGV